MARAHCMLDNEGYRNTLNIFTYCFLGTTLAAKRRPNITFIRTLPALCLISAFRREIDENCAPLCYYTANNGADRLSRNIGKELTLLAA
jgi:hypothetical protein